MRLTKSGQEWLAAEERQLTLGPEAQSHQEAQE